MQHLNSLQDLLVHELNDLYSVEQQLVVALPKMVNAATSLELQDAFGQHLQQTHQHVNRLENIFADLGINKTGDECVAMKGLIKESEEAIRSMADTAVRDAALIASAQRVEHYEMAAYGCARTFADKLGYDEVAGLLQQTLNEEGDIDKKLTSIAEGSIFKTGINEKAMA
ncbi:MAG: ferritin-like domain-containing protein [Chloroflexi bacterium]|nr:ferritin-like domain-containing protein [Chloroflexota bacterium]